MSKTTKTYIGTGISFIIVLLLLNPGLFPLPDSLKQEIRRLEKTYFLIRKSGNITFAHILTVFLAISILFLIYNVTRLILTCLSRRDERSLTVCTLLQALLRYIIVILGCIWSLTILGVDATAVLAGVGIVGLVLGFASQSLIEDIITGMFIIFEGQYSIGDIIILDDFRGIVRSIGVRTTAIEDVGGNIKVVNNSDIRNFQNRSRNISTAVCDVTVAYSTDIIALEQLLSQNLPVIYKNNADIFKTVPSYGGVEELSSTGITIHITVPCIEKDVFAARRRLNRELLILFAENGIEIPTDNS